MNHDTLMTARQAVTILILHSLLHDKSSVLAINQRIAVSCFDRKNHEKFLLQCIDFSNLSLHTLNKDFAPCGFFSLQELTILLTAVGIIPYFRFTGNPHLTDFSALIDSPREVRQLTIEEKISTTQDSEERKLLWEFLETLRHHRTGISITLKGPSFTIHPFIQLLSQLRRLTLKSSHFNHSVDRYGKKTSITNIELSLRRLCSIEKLPNLRKIILKIESDPREEIEMALKFLSLTPGTQLLIINANTLIERGEFINLREFIIPHNMRNFEKHSLDQTFTTTNGGNLIFQATGDVFIDRANLTIPGSFALHAQGSLYASGIQLHINRDVIISMMCDVNLLASNIPNEILLQEANNSPCKIEAIIHEAAAMNHDLLITGHDIYLNKNGSSLFITNYPATSIIAPGDVSQITPIL
ncbi:MAG: hypothetical protein AB2993_02265 [Candidatus Symbiodolus clandestinus]